MGWVGQGLLLALALAVFALSMDLRRAIDHWGPGAARAGTRLITVHAVRPELGQDGLSLAQIRLIRETGVFDGGAALGLQDLELVCTGESAGAQQTGFAGPGLFPMLGVRPVLGVGEDVAAGEGAVLAHWFWVRHCGARKDIVGQRLAIHGSEVSWPIVAVLPEGFDGLDPSRATAAWVPATDLARVMKVDVGGLAGAMASALARGLAERMPIFAYLVSWPRGFDLEDLQQVLDGHDLEPPPTLKVGGMPVVITTGGGVRPRVYSGIVARPALHERLQANLELAGGSGVILFLLTVVNFGLLWLGGLPGRLRYWRLCHALGAGPARLGLRHGSGAAGLLAAAGVLAAGLYWLARALLRQTPPFDGLLATGRVLPEPGWLVVAGAAAGSFVLAAALLPAWFLRWPARPGSAAIIGETRGGRAWASFLGGAQIAFAAFLLVLAVALALELVDQGRPWTGKHGLRMVQVSCPGAGQPCALDAAELLDARVGPGSWARASWLPMLPGRVRLRYAVPGGMSGDSAGGGTFEAAVNRVDPAFFRIMGLRVLAGAVPEPGPTAVVVNAAFCRRHALVPGECPGLALRWAEGGGGVQVAAVVEDLRYRHPGTPAEPMIYLDASAAPGRGASAVVAGRGSPAVLRRYLEQGLAARGRGQAVVRVYRLGEEIARTTRQERRAAMAAAAVAGYAALVALAGVYLRMRERVARGMPGIALRMAVGAPWGAVARELALRPMLLLTVALAAAVPGVALLGPALPQVVRPQSAYLPAAGAAVTVALGLAQATVLVLSLRRLRRVRLAALLADS